MSNYVSVAELRQAIGFQTAAMEAGKTTVQFDAELTAAITAVTNTIKGMIAPRYDVTAVQNSAILKRICLTIAKYDMYSQYARADLPTSVSDDKKEAFKMLEKIQRAELQLEVTGAESPSVEPSFDSATRQFGTYL